MSALSKTIIISRTDSIGDVMLTLPMCAFLKERNKNNRIIFLGRSYTKPIIENYESIDHFLNWDDLRDLPPEQQISTISELKADVIVHVFPVKEIAILAKKSKIPERVGTSHRLFHWFTCNRRVNFTRKRSDLHEAQLNFNLLKPIIDVVIPDLNTLINYTSFYKIKEENIGAELKNQLTGNYVVLHPKSQGSAMEWPMENYVQLARKLSDKGIKVVFTGTENEGKLFRQFIPEQEDIIDTTGSLTLAQLQTLIFRADALVACSTGPLHIAAFAGIKAIGLFSSRRPIHPGRWAPLGRNAVALVKDPECPRCRTGEECNCLKRITVDEVMSVL